MVASGAHGRKAGRGYYDYSVEPYRPADPEPLPVGGGDGLVVVAGSLPLADQLCSAAGEAGWEVVEPGEAGDREPPSLILDVGGGEELDTPLQGGPQAICCAAGSLATLDPGGAAVGSTSSRHWSRLSWWS